ncbi:MAG: M28 family peptidase [Candidatus Thorarchaeota archaeon]
MHKGLIVFLSLILLLMPISPMTSVRSQTQEEKKVFTRSSTVIATDLAEEVYNSVSESSILYFDKKLTENGSRVVGLTNNQLARSWLTSELANISGGKIEVTYHGEVTVGDEVRPAYNILGKLPGTLGVSGPTVMIGGHYDTVTYAPGANDDGIGCATTLELARILSQYDWPLDIYFCFWNYEEPGMWGSASSAPLFAEDEMDILVYFNIDSLLVQNPTFPPDERVLMIYRTPTGSVFQDAQYWAELTRVMNNNYDTPIIRLVHAGNTLGRTDLASFSRAGYKSGVGIGESGLNFDTSYHDSSDTWDNPLFNYSLATSTTACIGASIAYSLSRTLGQMTISSYNLTLDAGETKDLLLEVSMLSDLQIEGTWTSSGGLEFTLTDSSSDVLDTETSSSSSADSTVLMNVTPSEFGMHTLSIENTGGSPVTLEISIIQDTDIEGNGIPDSEEDWFNDFTVDSDSDLLSDGFEEINGLERYNSDSDADLMPDGWEYNNDLDPTINDAALDSDEDGLSNLDEFLTGHDPQVADWSPLPDLILIGGIGGTIVVILIVAVVILKRRKPI